ncbi:hypothetical protein KIPB_011131, partial [Kipferlia bialata]
RQGEEKAATLLRQQEEENRDLHNRLTSALREAEACRQELNAQDCLRLPLLKDPLERVPTVSSPAVDVSMDMHDSSSESKDTYMSVLVEESATSKSEPWGEDVQEGHQGGANDGGSDDGDRGTEASPSEESSVADSKYDEDREETQEDGDVEMSCSVPQRGETRAMPATPVPRHHRPQGVLQLSVRVQNTERACRKNLRDTGLDTVEMSMDSSMDESKEGPMDEFGLGTDAIDGEGPSSCRGPTGLTTETNPEGRDPGEAVRQDDTEESDVSDTEGDRQDQERMGQAAVERQRVADSDTPHQLLQRVEVANRNSHVATEAIPLEDLPWDLFLYLVDTVRNVKLSDLRDFQKAILTTTPVGTEGDLSDDTFSRVIRNARRLEDMCGANGELKNHRLLKHQRREEIKNVIRFVTKGGSGMQRNRLVAKLWRAQDILEVERDGETWKITV